jgi:hypothetical protein
MAIAIGFHTNSGASSDGCLTPGAEARALLAGCGTAEAVPFQNRFMRGAIEAGFKAAFADVAGNLCFERGGLPWLASISCGFGR